MFKIENKGSAMSPCFKIYRSEPYCSLGVTRPLFFTYQTAYELVISIQ